MSWDAELTKRLRIGETGPGSFYLLYMCSNFLELKKTLPEVEADVSIKKHTTFRIGGLAKYFFTAKTKESLILAIKTANKMNLPFYILGGGSNVLFSDKGFDGLIIKIETSEVKIQDTSIFLESGISTEKLTNIALRESLTGVEWAAGIPGTLGGAIRGNAGAFKGSIQSVVKSVEAFDTKEEKIITFDNKGCEFDYRNSIFKKNPNLVILSCEIQLKRGNMEESKKEMKERLELRRKIHPLEYWSAGCVFENPLSKDSEGEPKKISAGRLIGECGLEGKTIGEIKVSEKHSNFIVNTGNGKAEDVKELIRVVKKQVKEKTGIVLKEEIEYI